MCLCSCFNSTLAMQSLRIITTADGSSSILNTKLNETYHSTHGAIQESQYVFIDHGLDFACSLIASQHINILEIGFGTGLNALLALHYSRTNNKTIYYETLEAYPLEESVWKELNYATLLKDNNGFIALHRAPWNHSEAIAPTFTIYKREERFQDVLLEANRFDVIFYDAFAPSKQPELWEKEMLANVVFALKPAGIFVTYCAKGQLRRDLMALGMAVEKLPGPPGKREMTRARKI